MNGMGWPKILWANEWVIKPMGITPACRGTCFSTRSHEHVWLIWHHVGGLPIYLTLLMR